MRVHLGGDHAAYDLKGDLVAFLTDEGHEVIDHGPSHYDAQDDYPVFVLRAAQGVRDDPGSLGIVLGGSGNGEQIAANKVAGIRAALCATPELAELARAHNDAQVLSLGGRFIEPRQAREVVRAFLATPFSAQARHQRRLDMLSRYESDRTLPDLR